MIAAVIKDRTTAGDESKFNVRVRLAQIAELLIAVQLEAEVQLVRIVTVSNRGGGSSLDWRCACLFV